MADGLGQAATMAGHHDPQLGDELADQVDRERLVSSPEVALATAIIARMLGYAGDAAD